MQYLLSQLAELNIKVKAVSGQLHINAPAGTLTDEIKIQLRNHKDDLLTLLSDVSSQEKYEPLPTLTPETHNRFEAFPLTAIQHAYWMGRSQTKIELGGVSTHLYFESDTQGLDLQRLESTFNQLVKRHDMLRVIIHDDGMQQVLPEIEPYRIQVRDVRNMGDEEQNNAVMATRNRMSHQVLPTSRAPIFEVYATQFSDEKIRLHFSLDMLVLDAWSMMLLFREWRVLYDQPTAKLHELSITYRDYALAEEKLSETASYSRARDYWWGIIDNLPPAPQIPLRNDEQLVNPPKFSRRRFRLPKARWQILQQKAKNIGVTPTGIVLAAFNEVLTLWSSSPHYTLNVTLFNRQPLHPDVNNLLGDFTSLMLLEVDHRTSSTFTERAVATQMRFMNDLQHRAISGLDVMRELRRRRSAMMEAAMPVVFTGGLVYSGDGDDAGLLESFGPMVYGVSQTPQVSLDHQVMEVNGDLVCNWDCVDEKFAPGMLDDLYQTFCQLIEHLVDEESIWQKTKVVSLPKPQKEKREEINNTQVESPCNETLHGLFINKALEQPEAPAIETHLGETISYGELLTLANTYAEQLVDLGVSPDDRVAVIMHKGWEQIAAVMAILISGGAYLPISAAFPQKRRELLVEQGSANIVLTQPELIEELTFSDAIKCLSVERNSGLPLLTEAPFIRQGINNLAYVLFTSGTTGMPKGVMIEHRNAVNTVYYVNQVLGVTEKDKVLAVSALNFDLSVYDVFGTLCAGGTLVMPDHQKATDPNHWCELIQQHQVTLWNSAPSLMGMLVDHIESTFTSDQTLPQSMRMVWLSGDRIPVPLPDRVRKCFPNSRFISLGGPTETSIWSIYYPVDEVDPKASSIPYGKPLPNQTIHILNENLQDCPEGVVGMIYIGGAGLARGYLGDKEKTDERFIVHPDSGERLYNSGDLGRYLADGNVEILGRSDFQVKIRGYRIELGEIASTLTQHKDIKHAVAMPVDGAEGQKQVAAYVVLEQGSTAFIDSEKTPEKLCQLSEVVSESYAAEILSLQHSELDQWLNDAYPAIVQHVFSRLQLGDENGKVELQDFVEAGVADEYIPWCKRAITYLVEQKKARWLTENQSIQLEQTEVKNTESNLFDFVENYAQKQPQIQFLLELLQNIDLVLTGEMALDDTYYYGDAISSFHQWLTAVQTKHLEQTLVRLAETVGSEFTLLEVGAGLGGATKNLVETLAESAQTYLITDKSEDCLEYLYNQLAESYDNLEFGLFDLNESAEEQGIQPQNYHAVIASLVLSDVKDVQKTLAELKELLKPGGVLFIIEPASNNPAQEVYLGLQKRVDSEEGISDKNVVPANYTQWLECLVDAGFDAVAGVSSEQEDVPSIFNFIAAQAPVPIAVDTREIKNYLSDLLPDYMVPHHIVPLPKLPMSTNGKVDYKALPSVSGAINQDQIVQPRNDIEQSIYDCWLAALQVPRLSIDCNFFDAGGDSLLAAKVVRDINKNLPEFRLEMFEFFDYLTIEDQANLYLSRDQQDMNAVRPIESVATSLKYDSHLIEQDVTQALAAIGPVPAVNSTKAINSERAFLLTGATGWLGVYILKDLLTSTSADIYCLGRAENETLLLKRIHDNAKSYDISLSSAELARIKPFCGDLAKPGLGLNVKQRTDILENIEGIYHTAASVGVAAVYSDMKAANVDSVTELARLAIAAGNKPFNFCSSVAVLVKYNGSTFEIHKEETAVPSPEGLIVGYAQTKWAAESILLGLAEQGLPVKIYRIAHVLPDTRTHYAKPNYIFESILAASLEAGVVPEWDKGRFYGIPVNIVSELLVESSLAHDNYTGVIHMDNHNPPDFSSLIQLMLEIKMGDKFIDADHVNYDEWLKRCRDSRHQLNLEKQAVLNFLLEPTNAGTMFEALYEAEPSLMTYMDNLPGRKSSPLAELTSAEYWASYFQQVKF